MIKEVRKAQTKAMRLKQLRQDPRFYRVMGRLKRAGLLDVPGIPEARGRLFLKDVFWVGENIEPRVLELLPAILLKSPSMIHDQPIGPELKNAMNDLRRGRDSTEFLGIPLRRCQQWLPFVGRKDKQPTATKVFRMDLLTQKKLADLARADNVSEAELVRRALEKYSKS